MFKRILVATDGSPIIERELLYAAHFARVEPAELVVLHAYAPPTQYESYDGYEALLEQHRAMALTVVRDAVDELRADGVEAKGEVRAGAAPEAIIAAAAEHDVDLIIMGTRGASDLREMLGSVSAQVLRYARCPVLQVP